jgi:hypothetical protein
MLDKDLEKYRNLEDLKLQFDRILAKWQWEFKTEDNIKLMNLEIRELVNSWIEEKREEKINQILDDPLHRK